MDGIIQLQHKIMVEEGSTIIGSIQTVSNEKTLKTKLCLVFYLIMNIKKNERIIDFCYNLHMCYYLEKI